VKLEKGVSIILITLKVGGSTQNKNGIQALFRINIIIVLYKPSE